MKNTYKDGISSAVIVRESCLSPLWNSILGPKNYLQVFYVLPIVPLMNINVLKLSQNKKDFNDVMSQL